MALNLISLTHLGNSWNCSNIHIIRKKKSHSMRVGFLFAVSFFLFLKSLYLFVVQIDMVFKLFAILQKYEFSSKSQQIRQTSDTRHSCLRYCKSTSFQANHNDTRKHVLYVGVVCDTAKVRVFKQITTIKRTYFSNFCCLRYCKSTSFQANHNKLRPTIIAF